MKATARAGPSEYATLIARIDALERAVAKLTEPVPPTRDPLLDARRLSAIAHVFGGGVFVVDQVLEDRDPELRETVRGLSRRGLGNWLKRMKARPVGAYVVRRITREDRGVVWALAVAADIHTPA